MWSRTYLIAAFLALALVSLLPTAHAFGAGNIPGYSALEGKAFRHGDISDALSALAKSKGGLISRGSKFGGMDIKRIYFGNFLRDYSQAMDIAALEKMPKQTILTIVMVLSFLAFGYATGEFEVTEERLGVYRCEEHIDNPKGYGEGKDAKSYDPRLRGPIDPRELEVDPRSGMKNYIANEGHGWDTTSKMVRDTLVKVIQYGRRSRQNGDKQALYEAYRELGKALHAMEDLPAHSNWAELALHKLGYKDVFLHVGDNVKVRSPDGHMVTPLVTGTFGGSDFIASLLGEAGDHLSSASVTDLAQSVDKAKQQQKQGSSLSQLMGMLGKIPGMSDSSVSRDAESLSRGPAQNPNTMSPQEMYSSIFKILAFHDKITMAIETTIEKIPGLSSLIDNVTTSVASFTMTLIEPFVKPLMQQAMSGLHATSGAIVSGADQYAVFDNPNAGDPTHSQLSKDHFNLVLNEPCGQLAIIIDRHIVKLIVAAWDDDSQDPRRVADEALAPMFHPYWVHNNAHPIQKEMLDYMAFWAQSHQNDIRRLDKSHCRAHTNTRDGKADPHQGCGGGASFHQPGAETQHTGFGPALAHSVQGYVGLPQKTPTFGRRDVGDEGDMYGSSRDQDSSSRYGQGGSTSSRHDRHDSGQHSTRYDDDNDRYSQSRPHSNQHHQSSNQYSAPSAPPTYAGGGYHSGPPADYGRPQQYDSQQYGGYGRGDGAMNQGYYAGGPPQAYGMPPPQGPPFGQPPPPQGQPPYPSGGGGYGGGDGGYGQGGGYGGGGNYGQGGGYSGGQGQGQYRY